MTCSDSQKHSFATGRRGSRGSRRPIARRAALFVCIALALGAPAAARRLVARPDGADSTHALATALASAQPGDSILLGPGTYRGTHDLPPGVSLLGLAGPDSTTLDADGGEYVLRCRDLDSTSVIFGLTLQNGRRAHANSGGGGIYLYRSSPWILNNVFRGHLGYLGPGIFANYGSSPVVAFNVLHDNEGYLGGAIAAYEGCAPLLYGNVIRDNRSVSGGGILCLDSAPVVLHNTIVGNSAKQSGNGGGAALYCDSSPALVEANVLAWNTGGGAIFWLDDDRPATLRRNLLWANEGGARSGKCPDYVGHDGNCEEDPHFVDLAGHRLERAESGPTGPQSCRPEAGAAPWEGRNVPQIPDSVLAAWRAWRLAHSSP